MKQVVVMCCFCERVRDDLDTEPGKGMWQDFRIYMAMHMLNPKDVMFSHGYCPGCLAYYLNFLAGSNEARARPEKEREA